MKQNQLNCNECNFTLEKLNTFNTHMKRQYYLALGGHRITLLGQLHRASQQHGLKSI